MKTYDSLETAPLRFHRIYSSIVLPFDSFLNIFSVFTLISSIVRNGAALMDWFSLLETGVFILLIFNAIRGMLFFRKSALRSVFALLSLQLLNNGYMLWLYFRNDGLLFAFSSILSMALLSSILVYYLKRRGLFTKEGLKMEDALKISRGEALETEKRAEAPLFEEEEEAEEIGEYDCPRCGLHITDQSVFCPRCGAQTRRVRR